jgi:hypothetical protein
MQVVRSKIRNMHHNNKATLKLKNKKNKIKINKDNITP